jgi:hypothetical protein
MPSSIRVAFLAAFLRDWQHEHRTISIHAGAALRAAMARHSDCGCVCFFVRLGGDMIAVHSIYRPKVPITSKHFAYVCGEKTDIRVTLERSKKESQLKRSESK